MKVKALINTGEKILAILRVYEDKNISDMLDDIYLKVTSNKSIVKREARNKIDVSEVIESLKKMDSNEISTYLNGFDKKELSSIAKGIKLKFQAKDNKNALITLIANHYGFIRLNDEMATRASDDK